MKHKIAIIGNMNNGHYTLMRYLLDESFDCDLLLFNNEISHFSPQSDTFINDKYHNRIKKLDWGAPETLKFTDKKIIEDLKPYTF